jgi:hypothetical protein
MNLLSAVFGALGVAALYVLLRVSGLPRAASAAGALAWGFQRTYWAWSTVADRYSLVFFLLIASFAALLAWRRTRESRWLWLAALAQGSIWATHVAAPLYALPAALLLLWPQRGRAAGGGGERAVQHGRGSSPQRSLRRRSCSMLTCRCAGPRSGARRGRPSLGAASCGAARNNSSRVSSRTLRPSSPICAPATRSTPPGCCPTSPSSGTTSWRSSGPRSDWGGCCPPSRGC